MSTCSWFMTVQVRFEFVVASVEFAPPNMNTLRVRMMYIQTMGARPSPFFTY